MGDEDQLQKEWRAIVIAKLDGLDSDIKNLNEKINKTIAFDGDIKYLKEKVTSLEGEMKTLRKDFEEKYLSKEQFEPIKNLFWKIVGGTLLFVVTAILGYFMTK